MELGSYCKSFGLEIHNLLNQASIVAVEDDYYKPINELEGFLFSIILTDEGRSNMTYSVRIGSGGYAGWKILERTMSRQRDVFLGNHVVQSYKDYFSKNISSAETAEQFVGDHKLLSLALRAFGLDSDIKNKFFMRKILESDPTDKSSLVNRLADKRYLRMNQALALHASPNSEKNGVDVNRIVEKYEARSFERSVGENHPEIELALNARREILEISSSNVSENAKWYQILASKPLRQVFEGAYGLGSSFSALSIDRQLSELMSRTEKITGDSSVGQFSSSEVMEVIIRRFLLYSQTNTPPVNQKYVNALVLLGPIPVNFRSGR